MQPWTPESATSQTGDNDIKYNFFPLDCVIFTECNIQATTLEENKSKKLSARKAAT